ncbi:hypothetical protein HYPSUDRAFT_201398 [Hypholoma sublateritium FD-334 SS-4]|uniref:Uncharacterized protein n=1 Tax=Hypholoma sublateritium (strain FD-334 SS-4) TaxID=945553 RepID=A0A0D2NX49_HYPSF|nr:hypothetical protein HYPSUDRAFT_201398 [Hypholoma sublateritium FD-334 SS-4]
MPMRIVFIPAPRILLPMRIVLVSYSSPLVSRRPRAPSSLSLPTRIVLAPRCDSLPTCTVFILASRPSPIRAVLILALAAGFLSPTRVVLVPCCSSFVQIEVRGDSESPDGGDDGSCSAWWERRSAEATPQPIAIVLRNAGADPRAAARTLHAACLGG